MKPPPARGSWFVVRGLVAHASRIADHVRGLSVLGNSPVPELSQELGGKVGKRQLGP